MFDKKEFIEIIKLLWKRGLIGGYGGNISVKQGDLLLITPSGVNKSFLKEDDLITINMNGEVIDGKRKPSSEILMHLEIYKKREDIGAIIHSHPSYSVAICISDVEITREILPETIIYLGKIGFVKYIKPGTQDLANAVSESLIDGDASFMENHGVVVVGKNLIDAYSKIELLEEFSKSLIFSKIIGKTKKLPVEDSKYFYEVYKYLRKI
ncbi:MAG: class II aldolase/adducin family protein [Caldisericia bacterium]|nr:class II aldolase/adducin family protein [Caldisericia bacterium]